MYQLPSVHPYRAPKKEIIINKWFNASPDMVTSISIGENGAIDDFFNIYALSTLTMN